MSVEQKKVSYSDLDLDLLLDALSDYQKWWEQENEGDRETFDQIQEQIDLIDKLKQGEEI